MHCGPALRSPPPLACTLSTGQSKSMKDGSVTARVGTSAHGQGHITAFSMIIADMLGVDMDQVTVLQSDTDEVPRGSGTMGSRSLQTAGSAVHVASETVLDKAKSLAGHLLEASPEDIVKGEGGLHVAGVPANALTWAQLATAANDDACTSVCGTERTTPARLATGAPMNGTSAVRGSLAERPDMTSVAARRSATERASGPSTAMS